MKLLLHFLTSLHGYRIRSGHQLVGKTGGTGRE